MGGLLISLLLSPINRIVMLPMEDEKKEDPGAKPLEAFLGPQAFHPRRTPFLVQRGHNEKGNLCSFAKNASELDPQDPPY